MGYAVLHVSKGSGAGGGSGNHIDREKGKEHSFKNADPAKIGDNLHLQKDENGRLVWGRTAQKKPLENCIRERIEEGYKGPSKKSIGKVRKIRTDAVKFLQVILTGSHEDMKKIEQTPELFKQWLNENYDFVKNKFGAENIVRFTCHLDERTPHIHAVVVPLTKDGRLSAKEILGDRDDLTRLQDEYAAKMKPFGLERGIKGSKVKHTDLNDYYKRINKAQEHAEIFVKTRTPNEHLILSKLEKYIVPVPGRWDFLNRAKWAEKVHEEMFDKVQPVLDILHKDLRKTSEALVSVSDTLAKVNDQAYKNPGKLARENALLRQQIAQLQNQNPQQQKDQGLSK